MFIRIIRRDRWRQAAVLMCAGGVCLALLIWPEGAATGVSRGLALCAEVIIPSLFPFLVLTGFCIRSGFAARIGNVLQSVTRRLFGLSGCCGAAVVLGMIGGYPAGAAAIKTLLDEGQIEESEAKKALCFCVNGGPAFLIGTVGALLLGSAWKGVLLYASHLIASLIIGVLQRRKWNKNISAKQVQKSTPQNLVKSFTEAVSGGVESLFRICGFVVVFSVVLTLSDVLGIRVFFNKVMQIAFTRFGGDITDYSGVYAAFWEVGSGAAALSGARGPLMPLLLGAALGWGGISVHCQNAALLSDYRIIGREYWRARVLHALLGGMISWLLWRFVPVTIASRADALAVSAVVGISSVTPPASVAMLLTCGVFLLGFQKE